MGDEEEGAAGDQRPFVEARRAAVAQVLAIAAGLLAVASGLLMWRHLAFTTMGGETGVSYFPSFITTSGELLTVAPAGAGVLVAVVALTLRGRARWPRRLQIGLLLLALASSAYIALACAPYAGPMYLTLVVGDIPGLYAMWLLEPAPHCRPPALVPGVCPASGIRVLHCGWQRPERRAGLRHPHRKRRALLGRCG